MFLSPQLPKRARYYLITEFLSDYLVTLRLLGQPPVVFRWCRVGVEFRLQAPMVPQFPINAISDATWFALGVAATLFTAYVANRVGRIQISFMRKEHDLNVHRASPKMVVEVKLEERTPALTHPDVRRYFPVITVNNEGELAAEKLNGRWNLKCSESVHNRTVAIMRDYVSYRGTY